MNCDLDPDYLMEVASLQDPNTTTKYVSFNLYCDIMGKMDIMNKYFSGA